MPVTTGGRDFICDAIQNLGSPVFFDGTNTHLGVGDSATAFSAAHTDLQGSTKTRELVDGAPTQPAANTMRWVATFESGDANHAWLEQGVFNAASSGLMLARNTTNLGTKTSAGVWTLTYDLTLTLA